MDRYAQKIIAHANEVREGAQRLTKTDATYLMGVIDCDVAILYSKRIFNQEESVRLRAHVVRSVLANPSLLRQIRLRAYDKRAYRDF